MKRLFFGLWPDEQVRRSCLQIIQTLPGNDLRRVQEMNLHMTLLFLGPVNGKQETGIISAVDKLKVPPLALYFEQISHWKKPEILCLSSRHHHADAVALNGQLSLIAAQHRIVTEARPYTPHITLARKVKTSVDLSFTPITWFAESFCLIESYSSTKGTTYRVIQRWPCTSEHAQSL